MIQLRKSQERGHADHGWLNAYHSFSFADYHDPDHMHFGPLRVLNQDRIAPAQGFGTHGHADMEIVTYIIEGALEHKDDIGNGSQLRPGEVQLMSAGTGVMHSEFNPSPDEELHLLQMWVFPEERGTTPRYEQRLLPAADRPGILRLIVSPDGSEGSLTIGQDARLFAGIFTDGDRAEQSLEGKSAWLHVARGNIRLNGIDLQPGDGVGIRDEPLIIIEGVDDAELLLWELSA